MSLRTALLPHLLSSHSGHGVEYPPAPRGQRDLIIPVWYLKAGLRAEYRLPGRLSAPRRVLVFGQKLLSKWPTWACIPSGEVGDGGRMTSCLLPEKNKMWVAKNAHRQLI